MPVEAIKARTGAVTVPIVRALIPSTTVNPLVVSAASTCMLLLRLSSVAETALETRKSGVASEPTRSG